MKNKPLKMHIAFDDERSGNIIDLGHVTMGGKKYVYEPPQSLKTYPPRSRESIIQASLVAILRKTERL